MKKAALPKRSGNDVKRGFPLLEGEGQGEVCDLFGDGPHLTPTLSFQEREPVATVRPVRVKEIPKGSSLWRVRAEPEALPGPAKG